MICLSFDTEGFDVLREYGVKYDTIKEVILISQNGINHILQILDEESVKATFFCKSNFVLNTTVLVRSIQREGHEIASQGCDHWKPKSDNAKMSKRIIEDNFPLNLYVWMKNLLPQRLILIPSRKAHGGRGDNRIFLKQSLNVLDENVRWINTVEPVADVAQMGIEFIGMDVPINNPRQCCSSWQNGHNRKTTVPDTGMVGTFVSQNSDAGQPTTQNQMLWQSKILGHQVLCCIVGKVGVEFRNGSKCKDFKCLPCRWILRSVVFRKMLSNEIFLRSLYLPTDMSNVGLETLGIFAESLICKPKRVVVFREIANHLTAYGDFYLKDSIEDDLLQFCVETIDGKDVVEVGVGFEDMTRFVNLHRSPVIGQTKITCPVKDGQCLSFVINNKPPLFQGLNLLNEGKGLLGIFHTEKTKSRPVALPMRGRVPGSIVCKGTCFRPNSQIFWRKSA